MPNTTAFSLNTAMRAAVGALVITLAGCGAQRPAPVDDVASSAPPPDPDAQYQANATPLGAADGASFEVLDEPPPAPPGPALDEPAFPDTGNATLPAQPSSAADSLLREAAAHEAAGNSQLATASLERALRAAPSDGRVWLAMSRARLAEGRHAEAEGFARRALSLSAGNAAAEAEAWNVIADAREGIGDYTSADAARQKAALFSG